MCWVEWLPGLVYEVRAFHTRKIHRLILPTPVVLDCHPIHTTMVIIAGWAVKTAVAGLVSEWVSGSVGAVGQTAGEMWLAYSIP